MSRTPAHLPPAAWRHLVFLTCIKATPMRCSRAMVSFFGYNKCDTCRRARKWLDQHQIAYKFIDITEHPPSQKQLTGLITHHGYELKALFNRSGQRYRQLDMKNRLPGLGAAEAVQLLACDGKLCKRPIVIDSESDRATVGFSPETFAKVWKT